MFKSGWEVSREIVDQRLWITSTFQDIPSLDCIAIFKIKASLQNQKPLGKALSPVRAVLCQETPEIRRLELENFAEPCGDVVMLYSKPGVPNNL